MGFPAKMKKFSILVHKNSLDELIKSLHQSALVKITDTKKADKEFLTNLDFTIPHYYVHRVEKAYLRVEKVLEILDSVAVEKKIPLKEKLFPKPLKLRVIKDRDKEDVLRSADKILNSIEDKTLKLSNQREQINDRLTLLQEKMSVINLLRVLDIPLKWAGDTKYTHIRIGLVKEFEKFKTAHKENPISGFTYFVFDIGGSVKEQGIIAVSILGKKKEMDQFLHKTHFTDFDLTGFTEAKTPSQYQTDLMAEEKKLKDQKEEIETSLRYMDEQWREELEVLFEELEIEHDRDDIVKQFGRTKDVSVITGWVPVTDIYKLKKIVTTHNAAAYLEDPEDDDETIPIKLKNAGWARPYETMTQLFGLPKYNELDPTKILMVLFTFYFGVMLGDAGYGLIMLVISVFLYFSLGRVSPFMKTAGYIGICLSVVTILAGLYFGSVFGDLLPRFIYPIFGSDAELLFPKIVISGMTIAPYDALRDPMGLLIFSLIAGIITINIGIILATVQNVRNKKFRNLLAIQIPWFFIQPCGGLLLLVYFFKMFTIPSWAAVICLVGVGIGTVLLILESKYMFLFDYTGYLGDWLSFTRLMALGLGTTGIALVINVLVDLIVGSGGIGYYIIMIPVAIVLLILLHMFNTAIQALGAGIHSMRLQFVELFNRFLEGGGDEFTPFAPDRKLTKVHNEKKWT
jgi:V/A-type H+-transporting ATPase subunit I